MNAPWKTPFLTVRLDAGRGRFTTGLFSQVSYQICRIASLMPEVAYRKCFARCDFILEPAHARAVHKIRTDCWRNPPCPTKKLSNALTAIRKKGRHRPLKPVNLFVKRWITSAKGSTVPQTPSRLSPSAFRKRAVPASTSRHPAKAKLLRALAGRPYVITAKAAVALVRGPQ